MHHDRKKYDGYRLTTLGYDFLAVKALTNRGAISGVGRKIGVGKESDVYEVSTDAGEVLCLKLHRLGRTSFRAIKNKRDYLQGRTSYNWLYLSRLSALKEFAFMRALGESGFPARCPGLTASRGHPGLAATPHVPPPPPADACPTDASAAAPERAGASRH